MAGTRYCGFAEELTYGTKITADNQFFYDDVASAALDTPDEQALVYEGVSSRSPIVIAKGPYIPEGDITVPVDGILAGWFLKWLLGDYVRAQQANGGIEAYTHTFNDGTVLKSFTTRIGKEILQHAFEGCKISSGSLEIPKGEFAQLSMSLIAEKDSKDDILAETDYEVARTAFFSFVHAGVTIGGSSVPVETLTLEINNNISGEDGVRLGSRFPQNLYEGQCEVNIEMELPFDTLTQLNNFWGNTTGPDDQETKAVVITLTSETEIASGTGDYYTITITIPRCVYQGKGQPLSGRDRMVETIKLQGLYDSTSGHTIQAVILTSQYAYSLDGFFRGIYAYDADSVWTAGTKGKIYATSDGDIFAEQTSGFTAHSHKINAIQFFSDTVGYACGNGGLLLSTADGGTTWLDKSISGVTTDFYGLFVEDATTVFVVGSTGKIYKTVNSGIAWTLKLSGITTALYAVTKATGYVTVGAGGAILSSPDGDTWTPRTSGTVKDLMGVDSFTNVTDIYVSCGEDGVVLTSADMITWTDKTIAACSYDLRGVSCISLAAIVVVGDNVSCYYTANAGTAWTAKPTGQSNIDYYSVSCYSANVWWLCGTFESAVATTNGGTSFSVKSI